MTPPLPPAVVRECNIQPPTSNLIETTHCITCGDSTDLLRLDRISDDASLGLCSDRAGHKSEVMLALVPDARVGTWLVVHAGVALLTSAEPMHAEDVPG